MNIVSIIIIVFIILASLTGLRRGVIRETVNVLGNYLILILSFLLMGSISTIFYKYVPFLSLGMFGLSMSSLNILVYQVLSFAIIYLILSVILRMILVITNVVDNLIDSIIVFKTASKILGMVVGLIGGYLTAFIVLLILSVPLANVEVLHESKVNNFILNHTLGLSNITKPIVETTEDIYNLGTKITKDNNKEVNANQYNLEMFEMMLKHKVISYDTAKELEENGKLSDIYGVKDIIEKYKDENNEK